MARRITTYCLPLAVTLLVVPGCGTKGPRPVPVAGVVTIDGKPLAGGFIRVVPDAGRPSSSTIDKVGRFTLGCFTKDDGCLTGTHKVEVSASENISETAKKWLAPKKYASAYSSGLTVTIDKATDALKVDLTWAGSPQNAPFIEEIPAEHRREKTTESAVENKSRH